MYIFRRKNCKNFTIVSFSLRFLFQIHGTTWEGRGQYFFLLTISNLLPTFRHYIYSFASEMATFQYKSQRLYSPDSCSTRFINPLKLAISIYLLILCHILLQQFPAQTGGGLDSLVRVSYYPITTNETTTQGS